MPDPVPDPTPAPQPATPPSPTPAAPPPAAKAVNEGDPIESFELQKQIEEERAAHKKTQTKVAELEDTLHRLTTPTPAPKKKPGFWDGFLD